MTERVTLRSPQIWLPLFIGPIIFLGLSLLLMQQGIRITSPTHGVGRPRGAKPIPAGKSARTEKERNRIIDAHLTRTVLNAYAQYGNHKAPWDAAAARYLEHTCQYMVKQPGTPDSEALCREAEALMDAGCTDPQVLYFVGVSRYHSGDSRGAKAMLDRAVARFRTSRYPKARQRVAVARLAIVDQALSQAESNPVIASELYNASRALSFESIDLLAAAYRDGSYAPHEAEVVLTQLGDTWDTIYAGDTNLVVETLVDEPKADPYVREVARGIDEIHQAWEARGSGYANSVARENMKKFDEHLGHARTALTRAWRAHPDYPEAPTMMITVAMGEDGRKDSPRLWFDRAVAAQMDYLPAYQRLLQALLPRWGGSHDAMYALGVECLETKRFDTAVPLQFFRNLRAIEMDDATAGIHYWRHPKTYKYLQTMFAGYLRVTKGQEARQYQSLQLACAWRCQAYPEARRLLKSLGSRVDAQTIEQEFGVSLDEIRRDLAE